MTPEVKQVLREWRAQQKTTRYNQCSHSVPVSMSYWCEVGSDALAEWLNSRGRQNYDYFMVFDATSNRLSVRFADASTAMLFKLTYGGN